MSSDPRFNLLVIENPDTGEQSLVSCLAQMDMPQAIVQSFTAVDALIALGGRSFDRSRALPQVILVDYKLPEMDAVEFITRLRRLPGGELHYVVVLGTSETPQQLESVHSAGANIALRKPSCGDPLSGALTVVLGLLRHMCFPTVN